VSAVQAVLAALLHRGLRDRFIESLYVCIMSLVGSQPNLAGLELFCPHVVGDFSFLCPDLSSVDFTVQILGGSFIPLFPSFLARCCLTVPSLALSQR